MKVGLLFLCYPRTGLVGFVLDMEEWCAWLVAIEGVGSAVARARDDEDDRVARSPT